MDSTVVLNQTYVPWQMFAYVVGGLVVAVTALALYIKHLHSKYTENQSKNLVTMTEAMLRNATAIENNTEVNAEVRQLMHTVNVNIIELKGRRKF